MYETLSNTLEQLHCALSTLGTVIPPIRSPIDTLDFPEDSLVKPSYSTHFQPFYNINGINEGHEMGSQWAFGCLAPLLLAAAFEHIDDLDFKAYSSNFLESRQSKILSIVNVDHNTDDIEDTVRLWIEKCDLPNCKKDVTVRRCIVVQFSTLFNHHGTTRSDEKYKTKEENYLGHAITLGLELKNRVMTLRIYDRIVSKYVYAVHDQFFQWMIDAVKLHNDLYDTLCTELVGLEDKIHIDGLFMTCMSVAYRVCIYLSKMGEIKESDQDFKNDSLNFKKHIFRMIRWAKENERLKKLQNVVLISPAMDKSVYEINKENCYFIMAPYTNKYAHTPVFMPDSVKLKNINKDVKKRLRYSIERGFEEKDE